MDHALWFTSRNSVPNSTCPSIQGYSCNQCLFTIYLVAATLVKNEQYCVCTRRVFEVGDITCCSYLPHEGITNPIFLLLSTIFKENFCCVHDFRVNSLSYCVLHRNEPEIAFILIHKICHHNTTTFHLR